MTVDENTRHVAEVAARVIRNHTLYEVEQMLAGMAEARGGWESRDGDPRYGAMADALKDAAGEVRRLYATPESEFGEKSLIYLRPGG